MSKAIKWVGEYDGHKFFRSTARTYSHAIVVRVNIAQARAAYEAGARKRFQEDVSYWTEVLTEAWAAKRYADVRPASREFDMEFNARWVPEQRAKAPVELARLAELTEDGYAAKMMADYDKRNAKVKVSSDGKDYLYCENWAGRPDLAVKVLAQHSRGTMIEVAPVVKS